MMSRRVQSTKELPYAVHKYMMGWKITSPEALGHAAWAFSGAQSKPHQRAQGSTRQNQRAQASRRPTGRPRAVDQAAAIAERQWTNMKPDRDFTSASGGDLSSRWFEVDLDTSWASESLPGNDTVHHISTVDTVHTSMTGQTPQAPQDKKKRSCRPIQKPGVSPSTATRQHEAEMALQRRRYYRTNAQTAGALTDIEALTSSTNIQKSMKLDRSPQACSQRASTPDVAASHDLKRSFKWSQEPYLAYVKAKEARPLVDQEGVEVKVSSNGSGLKGPEARVLEGHSEHGQGGHRALPKSPAQEKTTPARAFPFQDTLLPPPF